MSQIETHSVRTGMTTQDMLKRLAAEADRLPRIVGRWEADPATGRMVRRWTIEASSSPECAAVMA